MLSYRSQAFLKLLTTQFQVQKYKKPTDNKYLVGVGLEVLVPGCAVSLSRLDIIFRTIGEYLSQSASQSSID